jgi:cytosine/adenosine deaminase-related metal-dependent hydrolase
MAAISPRNEAPRSGPDVTFHEFERAVMNLVHGGCCATPGLFAMRRQPAPPMRQNTDFRRLGRDAWIDTLSPRDPLLPAIRGAYVLPDVTVAHADRPDEEHVDVLVSQANIDRITPMGTASSPAGASVFERARGSFVSAALIDMHVHMPPANLLRLTDLFLLQTLRHGITIVREAGDTDGTATPAALECVASGALPGPEIHYAYGFVNAPPARWSNCFVYDDAAQANSIVKRLRSLGATWAKSYENLDVPRIDALKRAAREAGIGVFGHVPYGLAHEEALLPDSQHLLGMPPPSSIRRDHVLDRIYDWDAVDQRRMDVVRRATVEHQLVVTPTLNTATGVLDLERYQEARRGPTARALPSFYWAVVWNPARGIPAYRNMGREEFDRVRRAVERRQELVSRLHQDGVTVLLGTDTQQPFVAPGVALHREFDAFDQVGIPRRDSFRLATATAATVLGLAKAGKVAEGGRAEIIVSRTDPRQSSWSVQRDLLATIARGALVTAEDLDKAIRKELARFEGKFSEFTSRLLAQLNMHQLAKNFVS